MSDLISRQAAVDAIKCAIWDKYTAKDAIDAVCNVPPAERKKGRWEVAIGYDPKRSVMCSECRRMAYEPTPFCPNCGAEMRGEKNDGVGSCG